MSEPRWLGDAGDSHVVLGAPCGVVPPHHTWDNDPEELTLLAWWAPRSTDSGNLPGVCSARDSRPVRILVLSNMYPPHAYGGYEQSCRDVVERWEKAGHEVLVLTSTVKVPGVAESPAEERGAVRRELDIYWEDHEILNPPLLRRLRWERANARRLERALRDFRPDVVSAWAMGAMSMGLLSALGRRRIPVVSVICDEWPVYGPVVDAWLRPLASRGSLARGIGLATGLPVSPPDLDQLGPACFVSDFLRTVVRERSPWSFPVSGVVFSGIATDEFVFETRPATWDWRLLYVGRIDPRKGIDTVVRALALLPEQATLDICGTGDNSHLGELRELATSLGVSARVDFTSSPREELCERYAAADVLVFPPVWEEPFGLVPLEAMACGTPVVATTVGGAAEFLYDGENCVTFAPGDERSLVEALERVAADEGLRDRIVRAGRSTASELGIDGLAEVLEEWHSFARAEPGVLRPADRVLPSARKGSG